jgi:hypothetical protein
VHGGFVGARFHKAGSYLFETAKGRVGRIAANRVPDDQPVTGPWTLTFPPDAGAPREVVMETLIDWTKSADPGVRYFSGAATYHKNFTLQDMPEKDGVILDLGMVREVATVRINGRDAGILWKQPYQVGIGHLLKQGENKLEIAVTNLWNNRIVGDLQADATKSFTRSNIKSKFRASSSLLPSGLLGPVVFRFPVVVSQETQP